MTVRVLFQNVGGFSSDKEMEVKMEVLRRVVTDWDINIFGFTESYTSWDLLLDSQCLAKQTRGWWETSHWSLTHNQMENNQKENNTKAYQPGGTGILCVNQVAHRTQPPGDDLLGLGWWCWTRIRGMHGFFLRIVTMYCPCFSSRPLMTYQQHTQGLIRLHHFDCPQKVILANITKEIKQWQELGNQILLLTDSNDNVMSTWVKRWVANLGLVEAITYLHPEIAPPTYQRGVHPIDNIFMAPQLLEKAASRYLSFGNAIPSDHQAIWLDIHLPEVCPIHQEVYIKPQACWLQCKDPRIVDHYNMALLEMLEKKNLPQRIWELNDKLMKPLDLWHHIKQELNSIDNMIMEAKEEWKTIAANSNVVRFNGAHK